MTSCTQASVSPLPSPPAPHLTLGRRLQNPPALSATVPPPALPPPDPKWAPLVSQIHAHRQTVEFGAKSTSVRLSSCLRYCHLRIQPFPQFPPPVPPALLSYPAAPGSGTSPAPLSVHSSFQNCYASSRSKSNSRQNSFRVAPRHGHKSRAGISRSLGTSPSRAAGRGQFNSNRLSKRSIRSIHIFHRNSLRFSYALRSIFRLTQRRLLES
jgi:hypothetical protein